jgi:hypothetical protein
MMVRVADVYVLPYRFPLVAWTSPAKAQETTSVEWVQ